MILKIYKPVLFIATILAFAQPVLAQDVSDTSENQATESRDFDNTMRVFDMKLKVNSKRLDMAMNNLNRSINRNIHRLDFDKLGAEISSGVNDIVSSVNAGVDANDGENIIESGKSASERVKTYSKSYSVDANDKLALDNKYGRITINTWNKNEVKVDVQIKGSASDDETAQKLVDNITISDSKDGNVVSFTTNFGKGSSGSIWNLFNNMNDRHRAEVNYTIYMPSTMSLDLRNKYGSVVLPSLSGKVVMDNAYGSLVAKALTNPSNEMRFRYYEVGIEELKGGAIDLSYGSLKLGNVGRLEANVNYAPIDIEKLMIGGSFNVRYGGGVKIGEISKALKNLDINSTYSSVNVGLKGDENFDFDVTVKYGSFNFDENRLKVTSKSPDDDKHFRPTKSYHGYAGNNNSGNKITISSTYQSVKLE